MDISSSRGAASRVVWLILGWTMAFPCVVRLWGEGKEADEAVSYALVVTGNELLEGVYPDGHTQFITRTLQPLGLRCEVSISVADRRNDLLDALRFACSKAGIVIVTGGLGPTENDITRQTLADFTGIALKPHAEVVKQFERRFGTPFDQLRPNLRRQAAVPVSGTFFANPNGSAVGLVFQQDDQVIVALPGPPSELQPMVKNYLVPYLSRRYGTHLPGCSLTVRFVGLGQSQIDQTIDESITLPEGVTISSQFRDGRVDFTFTMSSDTPADHEALEELKKSLLAQLPDAIYATDGRTSLEDAVISRLSERRERLALIELGTGGQLAASLTTVKSGGDVVVGSYVATDEKTLREMVPVDVTAASLGTGGSGGPKALMNVVARRHHAGWVVYTSPIRKQNDRLAIDVIIETPSGRVVQRTMPVRGREAEATVRLETAIVDLLRRQL